MRSGWRSDSTLLWACVFSWACLLASAESAAARNSIVLNEVMASNVTFTADPQGQFDDWIELYNRGDAPADAGGLYLTDDLSEPRKWRIPTGNPDLTTIPSQGFLVIWADGDTEDSGLHAGFGLRSSGDEVALFDSDGVTSLDRVSFGPQVPDLSFGRDMDGSGEWALLAMPTPGVSSPSRSSPSREDSMRTDSPWN